LGVIKTVILIAIGLILISKYQDEETLLWQSSLKLNWSNFKGKPTNNKAAAVTASGLTYNFSTLSKNGEIKVDYTIGSYFYPDKSWYRPEVCDSIILSHEQLHFDITELYARKFREQLKNKKFTSNAKNEVRAIYKQINFELNEYQNLYDAETDFSRNREKQLEWKNKIATKLYDK
tara:strand:- start:1186 stop:1713 length:528 start_codon:yes stop_codon:yes gene_type:complete